MSSIDDLDVTVTAVSEGMTIITAYEISLGEPGDTLRTASSRITVVAGEEATISPAEATILVGGSASFTATGPADADAVVWSSDAPGVATVTEGSPNTTATVTGTSSGTAEISIRFFRGGTVRALATATVTVTEGSGTCTLQEGLVGVGMTGVEAIYDFGACSESGGTTPFGSLSLGCGAMVAGDDGFGVYDFCSQSVVYSQDGIASRAGGLFAAAPVQSGSDAAFILAGAQGDGVADTEGNRSLGFGPTAFDTFPAGGDPGSGWASTAGPGRGVCTWGPDSGSSFGFNRLQCFPSNILTGELVSSYHLRDGLDSPAFYLTRGVTSNVYYNDGSNTGFNTPAFQVGLDARRVRCASDGGGNYLCGITIFGTDQVSVFVYSDGGTPVLVGSIDVADGPVDLDTKYRSDGTYDLITSGFNDNRLTYLNLNANGTLNVRNFEDAPAGCSGLGHTTFLGNDDDAPVAGTCFTSGSVFLDFSVD